MTLFSKGFIYLLLVSLIIRIIVSFWSFNYRQNTDVLRYRDWGRISYLYGLADTYKPTHLTFGTLPNNQPPGTLYVISAMYNVTNFFAKVILKVTHATEGSISWINGQMLDFFLRFPSILFDLAIGVLIYLFVKIKKKSYALLASSFFLLNPVVIYNSAFWGQMDSINNFFLLLSVWFIFINKTEWVIPTYFISLFIKTSLVPIFPVLLLVLVVLSRKELKRVIVSFGLGLMLIPTLTLPISFTPWEWLVNQYVINGIGEMQNITAFAFNFWWVIFTPSVIIGPLTSLFSFSEIKLIGSPLDKEIFAGISLFAWALILYLASLLPIFKMIILRIKNYKNVEHLILAFALTTLVSFIFLPRMHERYIYPAFAFIAIYLGLTNRFRNLFILMTFAALLNHYIVWHPMIIPILGPDLIRNATFQWVIATTLVGSALTFYYLSVFKNNKNEKTH